MKKRFLICFILSGATMLIAQSSRSWQLHLRGGINHTEFYGKQPFPLYGCIEGCHVVQQNTVPDFQFGADLDFLYKEKYPIGFGYRYYRTNIKSTLHSLFDRINFPNDKILKYHSLFINYNKAIFRSKPITWKHSIGTDKLVKPNGHLRPWSLFYRTSLDIPIASYPIVLSPSIQIALSSYTKKEFKSQVLMRPLVFSLSVGVPIITKNKK